MAECVKVAASTVFNYIDQMLPELEANLSASVVEQWRQECPVERLELEQWLD